MTVQEKIQEREDALNDIINTCNDFETLQVPAIGAFNEAIRELKDDIVLIQVWEEITNLGKGYKESFKNYKGNFQKYKEDAEKLGLMKGRFFKDRLRDIGEGLRNRMEEFKGQIQNLIQSLSTLPGCFANPFTITAGFPIFFAILAQAVNISRALRIITQFILDSGLYKLDEPADELGAEAVAKSFDNLIIKPLIIATKPFVVLTTLIDTVQKLVMTLIGQKAWESLKNKAKDTGAILEKASDVAEYYETKSDNTYFGHLFECVEIDSEKEDPVSHETLYDSLGNAITEKKRYQYVGCNLLVKTGNEDGIECSKIGNNYIYKREDFLNEGNPAPGVFRNYIPPKENFERFMNSTNNISYPETDRTRWLNPDNWIQI